MKNRIRLFAATIMIAAMLTGCGAGDGSITARNISSDMADDGYYYVNDGVMQYSFDTKEETRVISNEQSSQVRNVYSAGKYLIYQLVDKTDAKAWEFSLMCADKENAYATTLLYSSYEEFWVNFEGDDLIVTTGKSVYKSPGALKDISLIVDQPEEKDTSQATDGSFESYICKDGSEIDFSITDAGEFTYEINGAGGSLADSAKYNLKSVAIGTNRISEVDETVVILLTAGEARGSKAFYDSISNSEFKEDILVEISKSDASSRVLYTSKSANERIVGYDGNIYVYKKGTIMKSADGHSFEKVCQVKLDSDTDYDFRWIGENLVVYDTDNRFVVASLSK